MRHANILICFLWMIVVAHSLRDNTDGSLMRASSKQTDTYETSIYLHWGGSQNLCNSTNSHYTCEPNTALVPTFACSFGDIGNWSDGSQTFFDPVPYGNQLAGITLTLTGRFNCGSNSTFIASIGELLVVWSPLPSYPVGCNCSYCMTNVTYVSKAEDFTGYTYGGWNTLELDVFDRICLSTVVLTLIYQPIVINLREINPSAGPVEVATVVNITGTGFLNTSNHYCSFDDTVVPATLLSDTMITCTTPTTFKKPQSVLVQASNDGVHFSSSEISFTFTRKPRPSFLQTMQEYWWVMAIIGGAVAVVAVVAVAAGCRYRSRKNGGDGYHSINGDGSTNPLLSPRQSSLNGSSSYGSIRDDINFREIQLAERIGRGNFGEVYKGFWRGTVVAVKKTKLPAQATPAEQAEFLSDFEREADIMRKLRHPNVLQFLGICKLDNSEICIITEFMPKGNLNRILRDKTIDISWKLRLRVAVDVSRGMNYLHKSDPVVIHRDLKSYNLLVDENFKVKVCDFGLAKLLEQQGSGVMTSCGTPAWTAPEVLRNERYTEKADVYSFGIVLWELVTREEPHQGMPPFQVVFAVGTQGIRPVIPSSCPRDFASLIEECWAESAGDRPAFDEIMIKLERFDTKTWL